MTEPREVAALYVDVVGGPYRKIPGVELWGYATRDGKQPDLFARERDARNYRGPWPVIAHPPCGPWGRFWWHYKGGEGAKDCGIRAVQQVRQFGGVLEHPAHSSLWEACGLPGPGEGEDHDGGHTVEVRQVDWGHPAVKPTWLYAVGIESWPELPPAGEPTHVMVRLLRNNNDLPELSKKLRHLTPPRFARWLVEVARSVTFTAAG